MDRVEAIEQASQEEASGMSEARFQESDGSAVKLFMAMRN